MTHPFFTDFEQRKKHVRHYLAVVAKTEREAQLGSTTAVQGRLLVLRAGTFLVLYNLVEASMRGAVEAIHDKITTNAVHFSSLNISLRKQVVALFKKKADASINHTLEDFPAAFVAIALTNAVNLSGSVDAKAIRELGARYGFSCDCTQERTRGGSDLVTIKGNRNDLAHGLKTFEEVGRDFTAANLLTLSRRSMRYMGEILTHIADYIDNDGYLEKAAM